MSFRIDPAAPLGDEVKRIAGGELKKAVQALKTEGPGVNEAVHSARKRFKKLRGLWRLVRADAPKFCARENARMRDMAASLSGARDAAALVESLDKLTGHTANARERAALARIRKNLVARRAAKTGDDSDFASNIAAAIATCEAAIKALDNLKLPKGHRKGAELLASGFAATCARVHREMAQASETGSAEAWHDLRKPMKYHSMHCRLMRDIWPSMMRQRAEHAAETAELLGDDHDLAVFAGLVETEPETVGTDADLSVQAKLAGVRSAVLREEAERNAHRLFDDNPQKLGARIELLWRAVG